MISELLPYMIALGAVIVALITIYLTRTQRKKMGEQLSEGPESKEFLPLKGERTITSVDAQKSKTELRLLDVEREILSYGIRRLYEAQAEGKINEKERERLAQGYTHRMLEIKESVAENESVVTLHELESMQDDLIKLFNDRFDDINKKIGSLRSNLDIRAKIITPKTSPVSTLSESIDKVQKKPRKSAKPKKTKAEERIDQIRYEVEKVLERLGQIETEA